MSLEPDRTADLAEATVVGIAAAALGSVVGALTFFLLGMIGWVGDGPGGGMVIFPLLLLGAVAGGFVGFRRTLKRREKLVATRSSGEQIAPNHPERLE